MHTNRPRVIALVLALALTGAALATDKPEPKPPTSTPPPVTVIAGADADAAAAAAADAAARAASDSTSGAASDAKSSSGGNALSTANDVLALELPGHAGATAVATECTVSRGSLGALGIGSGGRVKIDPACAQHVRCLENVGALERLGQRRLAVQLAAQCAGLELPADYVLELAPSGPVRSDPVYVTREEFDRAYGELVRK